MSAAFVPRSNGNCRYVGPDNDRWRIVRCTITTTCPAGTIGTIGTEP